MIRSVHPGFWIRIFLHPGSRIQGLKKHLIPDPDPQHWYDVHLCSILADLGDIISVCPYCIETFPENSTRRTDVRVRYLFSIFCSSKWQYMY